MQAAPIVRVARYWPGRLAPKGCPQIFSRLQRSVDKNWFEGRAMESPGTSAMVAFVMSEVPKRQLASLEGTVSRPDSRTQRRSRVDKIKERR